MLPLPQITFQVLPQERQMSPQDFSLVSRQCRHLHGCFSFCHRQLQTFSKKARNPSVVVEYRGIHVTYPLIHQVMVDRYLDKEKTSHIILYTDNELI